MSDAALHTANVTLGDVHYLYHFGCNCVDRICSALAGYDADRYIVVTDDRVLELHGDAVLSGLRAQAPTMVLSGPSGETTKSLEQLSRHLERALAGGATRRSVVVAFGGGVAGNLGGLIAALLFRGIRLVHIPTTTVAAMDSVLSLKQAINSGHGKNHIGTYYPPTAVYVDLDMLKTLPERQLRSGLCEAAKNALAITPQSLPGLRQLLADRQWASTSALMWLLKESLAAKSAVTSNDAREQRAGLVLEYGHTVGHAVELCDHRLRGADGITHGDAVALGMLAAARVSQELGTLDAEFMQIHVDVVALLGVNPTLPLGLDVSHIIDVVRADNKRGYLALRPDQAAMVLLRDLGKTVGPADLPLVSVPLDVIEGVLTGMAARDLVSVESGRRD